MTGGVWTNPLPRLLRVLEGEARDLMAALPREKRSERSTWAWRTLPRGALVAVRMIVPPDDLAYFEVRIAREKPPEGEKAQQAWEREIEVFVRELELTDPPWERLDEAPGLGKDTTAAQVFFRERTDVESALIMNEKHDD